MGGSNSTDVDDDDEVFVLPLPSDLALVLAAGEEEAGGAMVKDLTECRWVVLLYGGVEG